MNNWWKENVPNHYIDGQKSFKVNSNNFHSNYEENGYALADDMWGDETGRTYEQK